MLQCLLLFCVCVPVLLYSLYRWLIPAAVSRHGRMALFWHDVCVERLLDRITHSTRPERVLRAVQKGAVRHNAQSVISTIDNFCCHTEWAMNIGDEKGAILDSVVTEVNPMLALELGTYCGYSTVRIARLLPPGGRLITLEFNPDYAAVARQVIEWAGMEETVQLVEGASGDWIPQLKEHFGVETFDFVFLDHWKESYLHDLHLLEECSLLHHGSVLLADNVLCPGAPDYLQYVRNSPAYTSTYLPAHLEYTQAPDGLEKSHYLGKEDE